MKNTPTHIGMAAFFHSDLPIDKRLNTETNFFILKQPACWNNDICLFCLPEHLRKKWWDLAAKQLLSKSEEAPSFDDFLDAFRAFADFKNIPLPPECDFNILIRPPYKSADDTTPHPMSAVLNLGDEQTHIIIEEESILLEPGDGCWVPKHYTLKLGDTLNKTDVDVLLQIK